MRRAMTLVGRAVIGTLDRLFPSDETGKAAAAYLTVGRSRFDETSV